MKELDHSGHRSRLKKRITEDGFESLHPHEFLEYVLFASNQRRNTNDIAHRLLARFGTLQGVFLASVSDLMTVDGVGENSALLLKSYAHASEILSRKTLSSGEILNTLGKIKGFLLKFFEGKMQEEFHVLLLDSSFALQSHSIFVSSNSDKVFLDMHEVMSEIAKHKPVAVVFAHNHPSGNCTPSDKDISFTKRYFSAFRLSFDIDICEHMIFTPSGGCYSFRNSGTLEKIKVEIENSNGVHISDAVELGGLDE